MSRFWLFKYSKFFALWKPKRLSAWKVHGHHQPRMTADWFSWDKSVFPDFCLFSRSQCLAILMVKTFSLYLIRTSLVCNYACCLSLFCHAQLRRMWLSPLDNFLVVTGCLLPTPPRAFPLPGWACIPCPLSTWGVLQPPRHLGDPVLHFINVCLHCAAKPGKNTLGVVWWVQSWGGQSLPLLRGLASCSCSPGGCCPPWVSADSASPGSLSCKIPGTFSAELLPATVPSLYHCKGLFLPQIHSCIFELLNCVCLLSAYFSSLPRSHWMGSTLTLINFFPNSLLHF